jgi:hypothetical protein
MYLTTTLARRANLILTQLLLAVSVVSTVLVVVLVFLISGPLWVPLAGGGAATALAIRAWLVTRHGPPPDGGTEGGNAE